MLRTLGPCFQHTLRFSQEQRTTGWLRGLLTKMAMELSQALPVSSSHVTKLGSAAKRLALQPQLEPLGILCLFEIQKEISLVAAACPEERKVEEIVGVPETELVDIVKDLRS